MSKQLVQDVRNGRLSILDLPAPMASNGHVLIANQASLVSAGTEKAVMKLAQKSYLGKARERPDQVRRVLQKLQSEGVLQTVRQVREKLDEPIPMGYCSSGIVIASGVDVQEFKPGDRVASNGPHADIVNVPRNLCAKMGEGTSFEAGAFAVLGAIALHGIRLSRCTIGETVFVIGLGLVGQLTVALLNIMGCRVLATDLDPERCDLAHQMGATHAAPCIKADYIEEMAMGGADAVLITASTKSNDPMSLAVNAVRKKGRIVLIGVVGLELDRRPFYFKEAEFIVSCSYGPGRYDPDYEEKGIDYPRAYVRWTEQRNIQAILDLMAGGKLNVSPLITHRFRFDRATEAYNLINDNSEKYLGVVLEYDEPKPSSPHTIRLPQSGKGSLNKELTVGVLGAGNYARMVFLPALTRIPNVRLKTLCSQGGVSAARTGEKQGFELASTDANEVIRDDQIDVICILTRHNQHAIHVVQALAAGKNVFVEKPLCLTIDELKEIDEVMVRDSRSLMVGFNRRFAPATKLLNEFFTDVQSPLTISVRFNAGAISADHWTQDDSIGGGRIVGEACHGIDLATAICGAVPTKVYAESVMNSQPGAISDDQCHITMRHANGSISHVNYVSSGDKSFPKERIEVFGGERVAVIDDFRSVTLCHSGRSNVIKLKKQDKGHEIGIAAFLQSVSDGAPSPIDWRDIRATSLASILAVRSLREGVPFNLETINL